MPRPADISRGFSGDASPGSGIRNPHTVTAVGGRGRCRDPTGWTRFATFAIWFSAFDSSFPGLLSTGTRSAAMGNTSRSRCTALARSTASCSRVLQPERLKPRLVRQRELKHPRPVCARRPLRRRQRRGSSRQRLALAPGHRARRGWRSRFARSRRARVAGLGGVPLALRRERGPGSSARSRPAVAVTARSSLARDVACARCASSSSARRSRRVRRTHGAHTIGRSGICGGGGRVEGERGWNGRTGERE